MSPVTNAIVSKVWSFCTTLRDDGLAMATIWNS